MCNKSAYHPHVHIYNVSFREKMADFAGKMSLVTVAGRKM